MPYPLYYHSDPTVSFSFMDFSHSFLDLLNQSPTYWGCSQGPPWTSFSLYGVTSKILTSENPQSNFQVLPSFSDYLFFILIVSAFLTIFWDHCCFSLGGLFVTKNRLTTTLYQCFCLFYFIWRPHPWCPLWCQRSNLGHLQSKWVPCLLFYFTATHCHFFLLSFMS